MDAPERIWARPEHDDENSYGGFWIKGPVEAGATEYTRADLVEARIAEAVKAEREACAAVADKWADRTEAETRKSVYRTSSKMSMWNQVRAFKGIAAGIRARGSQ